MSTTFLSPGWVKGGLGDMKRINRTGKLIIKLKQKLIDNWDRILKNDLTS